MSAIREQLLPVIGKKININSQHGVVCVDVGETSIWLQWPNNGMAPQEPFPLALSEIRQVSWEETEHKVLNFKGKTNEIQERKA
jgi:hypothetical protein